jgi:hypothetical protein
VTGAEVAGDPLPSVMQALNETISQPLENRICRQTGRRWNGQRPGLDATRRKELPQVVVSDV